MCNIYRKEFIKLSALSLLSVYSGAYQFINQSALSGKKQYSDSFSSFNWDEFISYISRLAADQHHSNWNEQNYLVQASNLMTKLNWLSFPPVKLGLEKYYDHKKGWFEHDMLHQTFDFQVSLLQFEPEENIPLHDHPEMCGIIYALEGEVLIRNYNFNGMTAKERILERNNKKILEQFCLIEKDKEELLTQGGTSILGSTVGNIHELFPSKPTQLIDIFTPAYNETNTAQSRWYQKEEYASDEINDRSIEVSFYSPILE
jgi:hypothetical protein